MKLRFEVCTTMARSGRYVHLAPWFHTMYIYLNGHLLGFTDARGSTEGMTMYNCWMIAQLDISSLSGFPESQECARLWEKSWPDWTGGRMVRCSLNVELDFPVVLILTWTASDWAESPICLRPYKTNHGVPCYLDLFQGPIFCLNLLRQ